MAAKAKLSPDEWAHVRRTWEADSREGFAWLVSELGLPVSAPAIRKVSQKGQWLKSGRGNGQAVMVSPGQESTAQRNHRNLGAGSSLVDAHQMGSGQVLNARTPSATLDSLAPRERVFVAEYLQHSNGSLAAVRAGYSERGAATQAMRLLKRADIRGAIRELMNEKLGNVGWDVERVLQHYADIAAVDTAKITQHRIRACRHCWGIDFAYQCTPAEFPQKRAEWKIKRQSLLDRASDVEGGEADIGEFNSHEGDWYDGRREPNPDCPECCGVGQPYTWFADVRNLTGNERKAYTGVKRTKDGIEIMFQNPENAIKALAMAVGVGKEQEKPAEPTAELARTFWDRMQAARERQDQIYMERGIVRETKEH